MIMALAGQASLQLSQCPMSLCHRCRRLCTPRNIGCLLLLWLLIICMALSSQGSSAGHGVEPAELFAPRAPAAPRVSVTMDAYERGMLMAQRKFRFSPLRRKLGYSQEPQNKLYERKRRSTSNDIYAFVQKLSVIEKLTFNRTAGSTTPPPSQRGMFKLGKISDPATVNLTRGKVGNQIQGCPNLTLTRYYRSGEHPLTALASYPGSGNSWTCSLVIQLTGVNAGDFYGDTTYRSTPGFTNRQNDTVVVVKTHFPTWDGKHTDPVPRKDPSVKWKR